MFSSQCSFHLVNFRSWCRARSSSSWWSSRIPCRFEGKNNQERIFPLSNLSLWKEETRQTYHFLLRENISCLECIVESRNLNQNLLGWLLFLHYSSRSSVFLPLRSSNMGGTLFLSRQNDTILRPIWWFWWSTIVMNIFLPFLYLFLPKPVEVATE